mmetsp:Transcript_28947/g.42518  ORF Transcript_28947/g.42518 Transcript_28947/m.42518 type:complete len:83 (-) Transcript_28947:674-922(-)
MLAERERAVSINLPCLQHHLKCSRKIVEDRAAQDSKPQNICTMKKLHAADSRTLVSSSFSCSTGVTQREWTSSSSESSSSST